MLVLPSASTLISTRDLQPAKTNVLEDDTHELPPDLLEAFIQLWHTAASTVSQVAVVLQILRGREGGSMLLLLGLAQPIFRTISHRSLWDLGE